MLSLYVNNGLMQYANTMISFLDAVLKYSIAAYTLPSIG